MATQTGRKRSEGPAIVRRPGVCGGSPTIEGTRVRVSDIVRYHNMYGDVSRIVEALPHLSRDQVTAALRFYETHRDEIDRAIQEEEQLTQSPR